MMNCKDCRHFEEHKRGNLCWSDFDNHAVVNQINDDILEGEECCHFVPKDYQIGDVFEVSIMVTKPEYDSGLCALIVQETGHFLLLRNETLDKLKLVEREKLTTAGGEAREMSS